MTNHLVFVLLLLSACAVERPDFPPIEPSSIELAPPLHPLCECADTECREQWLCDTVRAPVCVLVDCRSFVLEQCTPCEGELHDVPATELAR